MQYVLTTFLFSHLSCVIRSVVLAEQKKGRSCISEVALGNSVCLRACEHGSHRSCIDQGYCFVVLVAADRTLNYRNTVEKAPLGLNWPKQLKNKTFGFMRDARLVVCTLLA